MVIFLVYIYLEWETETKDAGYLFFDLVHVDLYFWTRFSCGFNFSLNIFKIVRIFYIISYSSSSSSIGTKIHSSNRSYPFSFRVPVIGSRYLCSC